MNLGKILRNWGRMEDLSLANAAKLMRVEVATLQRIESGKMPSGETLRSILSFLLASPASGGTQLRSYPSFSTAS
jgi:transcriptional regulator with XRE-family HTH domain